MSNVDSWSVSRACLDMSQSSTCWLIGKSEICLRVQVADLPDAFPFPCALFGKFPVRLSPKINWVMWNITWKIYSNGYFHPKPASAYCNENNGKSVFKYIESSAAFLLYFWVFLFPLQFVRCIMRSRNYFHFHFVGQQKVSQ